MAALPQRWNLKRELYLLWNRLPAHVQVRLQRVFRWLNIGVRALMIPLLLFFAALLGIAAVGYIADGRYQAAIQQLAEWGLLPGATGQLTPDDIGKIGKYVGGGIGIALVFSTLKSVIESSESALAFITSWNKWVALTKPALLTFLTVAGLTLVLVAKPWNNDAAARTIQLTFDTNVGPVVTDDGLLRFVIPIADEAGEDAVRRPRDLKNREVAPDDLYVYVLASLATTLRRCVQSANDRVAVQVVGFSSSSLWEDVGSEVSRSLRNELSKIVAGGRAETDASAFNLWVAERRAENVLQVLTDQLEKALGTEMATLREQFLLEAPPWASLDAMMDSVRIDDEVLFNSPSPGDSGFLTRRVDVVVLRAGACERVSLKPASR